MHLGCEGTALSHNKMLLILFRVFSENPMS